MNGQLHLVTGGAGFIGSNIVAALAARGARVAVADHFGTGDKWRNIAKHAIHDLVAPAEVHSWLDANESSISSVVHMGGVSTTTETDCELIIASNFRLSRRLWEWCAVHEVPFIYASSAAVYGNGEAGFSDLCDPAELGRLRPLNAYGWSKLAFDRRVIAAVNTGEPVPSRWAGLRFFNVYGPNEYHKESMRSVIAINYPKVAAGAALELFKSYRQDYPHGGQMRDFVWIADCVDVVLWMLNHSFPSSIYNVGSGSARTWIDLGRAMFRALGKSERIDFIEMPPALRRLYQYFTEAPIGKLREAGYLHQMTQLDEGVQLYVENYLCRDDPFA